MNSQFSIGFGIALVLGIAVGALWPKYGPTVGLRDAQAMRLISNQFDDQASADPHASGGHGCGGAGRSDHGACGDHGHGSSSGGCDGNCDQSHSSGSHLAVQRGRTGQGRGQGALKNQPGRGQAKQGRGRREVETLVSRGNGRRGQGQAGNRPGRGGNQSTVARHEHADENCSGGGSCSADSSTRNHSQCNTSQHGHQAGGCGGHSGEHAEQHGDDDLVDRQEHGHGPGLGLGMGLGRGWGREFAKHNVNTNQDTKRDDATDSAKQAD